MSGLHGSVLAASAPPCVFGPLLTPGDIAARSAAPEYDDRAWRALDAMAGYVTGFLTATHPDLGRGGAVCPFAARALEQQAIGLTACLADRPGAGMILEGMQQLRQRMTFETQPGQNRAMVAVFPGLAEPTGARLIQRVQKTLKLSFVQRGLMIGEFYPGCAKGGLWNDGFKALQAPVISLAVRNITLFDAPFMLDRSEHAEAYVAIFGEAGAERIEKARHARQRRGHPARRARPAAGAELSA